MLNSNNPEAWFCFTWIHWIYWNRANIFTQYCPTLLGWSTNQLVVRIEVFFPCSATMSPYIIPLTSRYQLYMYPHIDWGSWTNQRDQNYCLLLDMKVFLTTLITEQHIPSGIGHLDNQFIDHTGATGDGCLNPSDGEKGRACLWGKDGGRSKAFVSTVGSEYAPQEHRYFRRAYRLMRLRARVFLC